VRERLQCSTLTSTRLKKNNIIQHQHHEYFRVMERSAVASGFHRNYILCASRAATSTTRLHSLSSLRNFPSSSLRVIKKNITSSENSCFMNKIWFEYSDSCRFVTVLLPSLPISSLVKFPETDDATPFLPGLTSSISMETTTESVLVDLNSYLRCVYNSVILWLLGAAPPMWLN